MKNKITKFLGFIFLGIFVLNSCTEEFLEVEPKGSSLESSYFKTADQMWSALIAVYNPLTIQWYNDDWCILPMSAAGAADECLGGGGGEGDFDFIWRWDNFSLTPSQGPSRAFWYKNYLGVARANIFLSKIEEDILDLDATTKMRYIAEVKFLRAYYYFELVSLFKNIVFYTDPIPLEEAFDKIQAEPDEVWTQIETDLREAMADLPTTLSAIETGRISQGACKALLAKVLLYKSDLYLNDNSQLSEVASLLEEVNNDYGYELQPNFPDVFSPNNAFNSERIFDIVHTNQDVSTNFDDVYGNLWVTANGPRGWSDGGVDLKYVGGWGATPVETAFAEDMKGDPRYEYTIFNADELVASNPGASYQAGYQNTGYFIEKWAATKEFQELAGGTYAFRFPHNMPVIRLADTYLLEAEALVRSGGNLTKAASYLNAVRARVGLEPVEATMENIKQERKYELAFEGARWFDLVRWGDAPAILGSKGFTAGTHEIIPIPITETYNTDLVQNPNYN